MMPEIRTILHLTDDEKRIIKDCITDYFDVTILDQTDVGECIKHFYDEIQKILNSSPKTT